MEKIVLVLITTVLNSTWTSFQSNKVVETPSPFVSIQSETKPEAKPNIIPKITRETHSRFNPTVYGNATRIDFSNGISFDTKHLGKSGEPNLPKELKWEDQTNEPGYYIVQFAGPIYQVQKDWLKTKGVAIHFYVPHYGFICSMKDQATTDAIRANPSVNWVGIYQPAYKISTLFDRVGEEHKTTILLFMDADISMVFDNVKALTKRAEFTISDNGINKIIQGVISKKNINALSRIKGIYWIEPYIQPQMYNNNVQWIVQDADNDVRNIWAKGIAGEGEIVSSMDSGINCNHYAHRSGSSAITTWGYYPTHNAIVAYDSGGTDNLTFGDGGSYHGTHTSGTMTGDDTLTSGTSNRDGVAKKSKIYFLDIAPNTGQYVYPYADLNDGYIKCYSRYYPPTRAYINTNSWGADAGGEYDAHCLQVDQFMWAHKDFLLFYSNGNAAVSGSVGSPASAKNCVSVGGCRNGTQYTQYYGTTSRGPTQDGRLKPTILTPGPNVYSSTSGTNNYSSLSGTSMSSPSAAGAGALVRQYLREGWYPTGKKTSGDSFPFISASLVKAILINCADPNVGSYTVPDNNLGWGRIDLDSTLYFTGEARKTLLVDNTVGLLTGERVDYHFNVPAGAANLKIAVVWTDYPGNPAVLRQIVNDLNLSAYNSAHHYHGNQYSSGQSIQDPTAWDSINVEECIRVNTPTEGDWRVSVEGRNVAIGPQPYSLVITYNGGAVAGVVSLDQAGYTANEFMVDTVRIRVEDPNYGSAIAIDSVMVVIHGNLFENEPESLWCRELAESAYVFKGEFPLLFNKPVHGDGYLSVAQGDTITVSYTDVNPNYTSTTWAGVDMSHFSITNVRAENIAATTAEICWTTDKNANSTVYYGTDPGNLNQTTVDSFYAIPHRVRLSGLNTSTTYYYDIGSEDFYGNMAFDNNGENHYSFTTRPGGEGVDVMVVVLNSDGGDEPFAHPQFVIDALDEGGWTYNWWQTKQDGDFSRDMLKDYKAVFFQVANQGSQGGNYPVWTVAQKETMKVYHNGGARFTMVGFDIGWDPWEHSPSADTNFCKDYLHFRYIGDIVQTSWRQLYGMPGDPISGDYYGDTVAYHPSRNGAAGDSIRLSGTGAPGTGSYCWHGRVPNDSCAIKWESTNNMGTPGNGVWGGHKTRVVTNAFDISQIDTVTPDSPERTDILNKLFIWLIGHDHPDVTLSSPISDTTYTSSSISIAWTSAAHGGASLDTTRVEYSPDEGQTWFEIATGITSPYSWDISSMQNGVRYRVRVTVKDKDVYPSMKGSDGTEDFTINIPGNDDTGPKVIPQSIAVGINPKIVTATDNSLPISAVINDSLSGLSTIMAAEWSIGSNPTSPGNGAPMNALDGTFDAIQETVIETLYFNYAPGVVKICSLWVRGQDAATDRAENWGNALMRTFTVIDGNPVGISETGEMIPLTYSLASPLPNPFLRHVSICYAIPKTKKVRLKIYNCLGQVVKTLVDELSEPGFYTLHWNGRDDLNRKISAGIYFCRLSTDEYTATKKMVMIK